MSNEQHQRLILFCLLGAVDKAAHDLKEITIQQEKYTCDVIIDQNERFFRKLRKVNGKNWETIENLIKMNSSFIVDISKLSMLTEEEDKTMLVEIVSKWIVYLSKRRKYIESGKEGVEPNHPEWVVVDNEETKPEPEEMILFQDVEGGFVRMGYYIEGKYHEEYGTGDGLVFTKIHKWRYIN